MRSVTKLTSAVLSVTTTALLVTACGGGDTQTAGIDRGGVYTSSVGPIDGFGSVISNGTRYDVSTATININGALAVESELKVGQIVVINAEIATAGADPVAGTVSYESNLQGPVTSIDLVNGRFAALGQTIYVTVETIFGPGISPSDLSGLSPGDVVEVSGQPDAVGRIRATRIDPETAPYEIQLSGLAIKRAGSALSIGSQVVDDSGAMINGFPGGVITSGDRVRVTGSAIGAAGEIIATQVVYRGDILDTDDGDEGEVEGLITNFASAQDFLVSGIAVATDAQTQYSGGTSIDLADNVLIEVEGSFNDTGVLIAEQIEFKQEGDVLVEAAVDTVDAIGGTATVFGVVVQTTPMTVMSDERDGRRPFTLNDLVAGDFLKTSGTWNGSQVVATQLERIGGEDKYKLKGRISAAASPDFTLLGRTVQTVDGATDYEVNDAPADLSQFFNAVNACLPASEGCRVEVAWQTSGSLTIADKVELDD